MKRLIVAALILVAAVLGLLGAAAWNAGRESAIVTLTEREIQVRGNPQQENTELRLGLVYQHRNDPLDARTWLTETRLAELGFSLAIPANAPEAERTYDRGLPRLGFVALELDGPAWQAIARQHDLSGKGVESREWWSRLVPIDAGPDGEVLASRYAGQRVIVLPAVFRVQLHRTTAATFLYGSMDRLVTEEVTGSIRLRQRLRELPPRQARYDVDLVVGRLGVPRIVDLRPR
jgi:hypothetical protein